jgi:hypothetical protein
MSPLWQRVYDANYHKSLDHRSFYFKQTDKRLLGAKGMIADIRGACSLLCAACLIAMCTMTSASSHQMLHGGEWFIASLKQASWPVQLA